jgi:hypothetical protein
MVNPLGMTRRAESPGSAREHKKIYNPILFRFYWLSFYEALISTILENSYELPVIVGHVLRASKRVFGIPDFRLYALADGIRQFLYSQTQGLTKLLKLQNPLPVQSSLFDS